MHIEAEYDEKHDWVEIYRDNRKVITLDYDELMQIAEDIKNKKG